MVAIQKLHAGGLRNSTGVVLAKMHFIQLSFFHLALHLAIQLMAGYLLTEAIYSYLLTEAIYSYLLTEAIYSYLLTEAIYS